MKMVQFNQVWATVCTVFNRLWAVVRTVFTVGGAIIVTAITIGLTAYFDFKLEDRKEKYAMVLQAIAAKDDVAVKKNIDFFIAAGLLKDSDGKIREAVKSFHPTLTGGVMASAAIIDAPDVIQATVFVGKK
jgi:hypothetical protein